MERHGRLTRRSECECRCADSLKYWHALALRLTFASGTKTPERFACSPSTATGADALKLCRSLFESTLVAYRAQFLVDPTWVTTRMNEHQQFSSLILIEVLD